MVTVDMSKTRLRISKRKRRIRRLQRRRIQKAQREQQAQLLAAGKAKESRDRAIQNWIEEEKRLARQRETSSHSPSTPKRKLRVRFAENVSVTEIPTKPQHKLPKPISSPIGVRLARDDENNESPYRHLVRNPTTMRFALFSSDEKDDESNDPDFVPGTEDAGEEEEDEEEPNPLPITTSKRRMTAVPVPLRKSTTLRSQKTLQGNASNSSQKPADQYKSRMSPITGKSKTIRAKTTVKTGPPEQCEPCVVDAPPNGLSQGSGRKRKHHALNSHKPINTSSFRTSSPSSENRKSFTQLNVIDVAPNTPDSSRTRKNKRRRLVNGQYTNAGPNKLKLTERSDTDLVQNITSASEPLSGDETKCFKPKSPPGLDKCGEEDGICRNSDRDDSEIDALFGELVRQKAQKKLERGKGGNSREESGKSSRKQVNNTGMNGSRERKGPTRYTEEGFRIMTYDEIKADQPSGLNGDCPFDCSCCF